MTLVILKFAVPEAAGQQPSAGALRWTPTKRRTAGDWVVMPAGFTVPLVNGEATVEVAPTGADWVWRVDEHVPTTQGGSRYVAVPDLAEIDYTDLIAVDPKTLEPSADPDPAWYAYVDTLEGQAATASASAVSAKNAAEAAQLSATGSETSAAASAATATTKAAEASTSATNAAGSAAYALTYKNDAADSADLAGRTGLTIGTVTTVDFLEDAEATITGENPNRLLNLSIPHGPANELEIGEVITVPGTPLDDEIVAEQVLNGVETQAALNATYGQKARVYHDFTGDADGALTTLDSGQPWHLATTPGNDAARLRVVNGFMTNTSVTTGATSAGHAMVTTINESFNRIGADIAFEAGTTSGGVAGLIIWSEPLIYPGPVVDSAMHLTFSTLGWDLTTFTGGVGTSVSSGTYLTPLVEDGATLYRVEAVIPGDGTVLVTLPDGRIVTVAVAALATKARIVPAWETFQGDASTNDRAKFKRVWADTAFGSPTEKFASVPQVTQTVKTVVQASRGVAVQYPAVGAGNVALTIPTTATEINAALRASFVAPQSGKVMVTLNGQINQTAAGDIQWTLLIPEGAGQTHLRMASKIVQEQVITLTILVTGLTPGSVYSTRWQHRATGASAGVMRLNADGGQLATLSVQPVN